MLPNGHRTVMIKGEQFKFSCAHFVSYPGFRERLHGHNYTMEVEVAGTMSETDGYVLDFGVLKKHIRALCKSLNERIIIPELSNTLQIKQVSSPASTFALSSCSSGEPEEFVENTGQIEIVCGPAFFSLPKSDCALLPIRFSTAEELSKYLALELKAVLPIDTRDVDTITVRVFERPTQAASFTLSTIR